MLSNHLTPVGCAHCRVTHSLRCVDSSVGVSSMVLVGGISRTALTLLTLSTVFLFSIYALWDCEWVEIARVALEKTDSIWCVAVCCSVGVGPRARRGATAATGDAHSHARA